jgi:hypothetical protein
VGVSKARKGGQYTGGRPFPVYCPVCRKCGGGKPSHFYNSRGLCNICHREERREGRKYKWPNTPTMLSDGELRRLAANPLRWLRHHVGQTHLKDIPPHLYELEAWRIIHVTVCRWYGEKVYLDPIRPSSFEDVVWAAHSPHEEREPAALVPPPKKAAPKKRKRARTDPVRDLLLINVIRPLMRELREVFPQLPQPRLTIVNDGWALVWAHNNDTLVVNGPMGGAALTIELCEGALEDSTLFDYQPDIFKLVWDVFQTVQTHTLD